MLPLYNDAASYVCRRNETARSSGRNARCCSSATKQPAMCCLHGAWRHVVHMRACARAACDAALQRHGQLCVPM